MFPLAVTTTSANKVGFILDIRGGAKSKRGEAIPEVQT
jgi:hypothetical protein